MIRLMTYNIRAALGTDGARSVERIASVIAQEEPHIVALQEVDFNRVRSGSVDQAERLAEILHAKTIPGPSFTDGHGWYGNAVLSRIPAELVHHERLPHLAGTEPRSAMWVRVETKHGELHVLNTHLSFRRRDRPRQIAELLGPRWLGHDGIASPSVLCGDLNCTPRDAGFRRLLRTHGDAQALGAPRPASTWPTRRPFRRIDHVLVSQGLVVLGAKVARNAVSRVASDHYPIVVEFDTTRR